MAILSEILSTTITRSETIRLGLIGWVACVFGVYSFIKAMNEVDERRITASIIVTLFGLFMVSICPINWFCANDYAANNKNNLISINAVTTNNEKAVMKFKEPDNSIKEIKAPVKEKVIKDKNKHNKYSLKEIKDGYVIYYIAEDVEIPSKPTLEYFNGTKPLANVVKE